MILKKILNFFDKKSPDILKLEENLGYSFKNSRYLKTSITHRSIQNNNLGNYERLEFIGDAVIDQTVSIWLFNLYPDSDEGTLTKKRSSLVNRDFLAHMGHKLNLIDFVQADPSVKINDPKVSNKIAADIYEAIVGAIYLDGGYKKASSFIKKTLCSDDHLINIQDTNYKGQLIEYCHQNGFLPPQFIIKDSYGPEHNKTFMVKVKISDNEIWEGVGSTKKSAEQQCAQNALKSLLGC